MKFDKTRVVAEIREYAEKTLIPPGADPEACCVYHAAACVKLVPMLTGLRCFAQAGSCLWPRVRPEQDDGVVETHYGYEWQGMNMQTAAMIAAGLLPEVHFWAAVLDPKPPFGAEVLDVTTRDFPAMCLKTIGKDWPGDPPPDFLWDRPAVVKGRPGLPVRYEPSETATVFAMHLTAKILRGEA